MVMSNQPEIMNKDNQNLRIKLLGFSPWILGSACILLLLVIAFFAVSNYEREKKLISQGLEHKGLTLVRFINSSVSGSVRSMIMNSSSYDQWEAHMQPALELAVEQPGVDSIILVDKDSNVLLSAGNDIQLRDKVGGELLRLIKEYGRGEELSPKTTVLKSNVEGENKAILVTRYVPPRTEFRGNKNNHRNMMGGRFRHSNHFESFKDDMRRVGALTPLYLVQLDFSEFTAPLRRQFIQIVLELTAIFLVGVGGTLSFFTLRGLRGSELSLGKMKEFNEVLVASLPVGLIAIDENDTIQVINDAAAKITGLVRSKTIGIDYVQCLPVSLHAMLGDNSNEKGIALETHLGNYILDVSVVPVTPGKGVLGGKVMLIRDLTKVKRLESELQRSERLAVIGKMAAGVAHELRNPLSSIKGLTLLLKSKLAADSDGVEAADTLVREVERLNRSIGELLDYAKPGRLLLEPFQITTILDKTLSLVEPELAIYGVRLAREVEDGLPNVLIDKDKLSQVLLNILLNALQAMEDTEGQRILTVKLHGENDWVLLSIADTGCGIASQNLKKIFDPYFTTKNNGTGLGLALSLKIVEEHGGKLLVSSVVGEKTAFQLKLRAV
ncbi:MAG: two-component system sensor histidine kinase HydH [Desulforhopalus sp.]|jgi:two-component system sensor histidine kinase HydH